MIVRSFLSYRAQITREIIVSPDGRALSVMVRRHRRIESFECRLSDICVLSYVGRARKAGWLGRRRLVFTLFLHAPGISVRLAVTLRRRELRRELHRLPQTLQQRFLGLGGGALFIHPAKWTASKSPCLIAVGRSALGTR